MIHLLAFALLRQTGFDLPITVEMKDALVTAVLADISGKAQVQCKLPNDFGNLKVSVFAKDVPAHSLLDRIASTLGLDGSIQAGRYFFRPGLELKATVSYMDAEAVYRNRLILGKLEALARMTSQPFGSVVKSPPSNGDSTEEGLEDPNRWAAERISQPGYYALGVQYRLASQIGGLQWQLATCPMPVNIPRSDPALPGPGTEPTNPFLVDRPEEPLPLPYIQSYMDENSAAIRGTMIAYGFLNSTGEIRVSVLKGTPIQEKLMDRPFLFAKPPKALAKERFVQILDAWQMRPEDLPKELQSKPATSEGTWKDPGYFDKRISLTEKLEQIHLRTGIPIVATSFRTPALDQGGEAYGTAGEAIKSLAAKEKCFLRSEDGFLLVRHPAYWILRNSEPPESMLLQMEKISQTRPLTLPEYGDLAFALGQHIDSGAFQERYHPGTLPHAYDRLLGLRGMLLRFDGDPLATAYPVLYFVGGLSAPDRAAFLEGNVWNCALSWHYDTAVTVRSKPPKTVVGRTGTTSGQQTSVVVTHVEGTETPSMIAQTIASAGPLFNATMSLRYMTPAELGHDIMLETDNGRDTEQYWRLMLRAKFIWLETLDSNHYVVHVGFPGEETAAYPISIAPTPN